MADSHGRPELIEAAISFLKKAQCEDIYHLGDICDSIHIDTVVACVSLIRENNIKAVRGNNDHRIVIDNQDSRFARIPYDVVEYLKSLPVVIESEDLVATHSLPFYDVFGVSCMTSPMRKMNAVSIFAQFPGKVLFRGHSHAPWIIWKNGWKTHSQPIDTGEHMILKHMLPCVVTCGALTRQLCMIWTPEKQELACLSIE